MSIKIAVPDNPVYSDIVFNLDGADKDEVILFRVPEHKCSELLFDNRVDAAFISPMAYGKPGSSGNFRIVPGPVLAFGGYSGKASIYFRPGAAQLNSCSSPNPDDYLIVLGKLLLMERYDIELSIDKMNGTKEELLRKADSVMLWEQGAPGSDSLDISELWSDSFEIPLILGFWVCPAEDFHPAVTDTVKRIWNSSLKTEEPVIEITTSPDIAPRDGFILRQWNDELESALEKTIDLLFYHQLINEIEEVKFLGRD